MNDECGMMKSEEGEEGLGIEAGIGRSGGVTPYMIVVFSVSGSVSGSVSKLLGNAPRNFGFRFSIEPDTDTDPDTDGQNKSIHKMC